MDPSLREIRKNALVLLNQVVINEDIFSPAERVQAATLILQCLGSPSQDDLSLDQLRTMVDRAPIKLPLDDAVAKEA